MKNGLKKLAAAIAFAGACSAHAFQPSEVFVFGDSLSDSGYMDGALPVIGANIFTEGLSMTGTGVPGVGPKTTSNTSPAYPQTNPQLQGEEDGKVWPVKLAKYLNDIFPEQDYSKTANPNNKDFAQENTVSGNLNGDNYAAGGAVTHGEGIGMNADFGIMQASYFPPSVDDQVDRYLDQHNGQADSQALYIIWAGANNLLKLVMDMKNTNGEMVPDGIMDGIDGSGVRSDDELYNQGQETIIAGLQSMAADITRLREAGANNFIVIDMPQLDMTPLADQLVAEYQLPDGEHASNFNFKNIKGDLNDATAGFNSLINQFLYEALNGTNYAVVPINKDMQFIAENGYYQADGISYSFDTTNFSTPACQKLTLGAQYDNVPMFGNLTKLVEGLSTSALTCNPQVTVDGNGDPILNENPPQGLFFEDSVHPTSRVHTMIAHKLKEIIVGM